MFKKRADPRARRRNDRVPQHCPEAQAVRELIRLVARDVVRRLPRRHGVEKRQRGDHGE